MVNRKSFKLLFIISTIIFISISIFIFVIKSKDNYSKAYIENSPLSQQSQKQQKPQIETIQNPFDGLELSENNKSYLNKLIISAKKRLDANVIYDPAYFSLEYPNGDVPANKGVCTDVLIRSLRGVGVDLQELVYNDISTNFTIYPSLWGLNKPDPNIDHRRVPNLITFFNRFADVLPITDNLKDYYPGDIITWVFDNGKTHTGIIVDKRSLQSGNPLIVHNVGGGPQLHDVLFEWKITGHFRYFSK